MDPLRGQADFSIIEKISGEPKKKRRQGESRDVQERADRAAAAEALGYLSQPDDDDFDLGYMPPRARNREQRRKAAFADRGDFARGGRGGRGAGGGKPRARKTDARGGRGKRGRR